MNTASFQFQAIHLYTAQTGLSSKSKSKLAHSVSAHECSARLMHLCINFLYCWCTKIIALQYLHIRGHAHGKIVCIYITFLGCSIWVCILLIFFSYIALSVTLTLTVSLYTKYLNSAWNCSLVAATSLKLLQLSTSKLSDSVILPPCWHTLQVQSMKCGIWMIMK